MNKEKKERHLRLVTDNDPDYKLPHQRELEGLRSRLDKKQQECDKAVKNLREKHTKDFREHKRFYAKIGSITLLAVIAVAGLYTSRFNWNNVPKNIVQLDQDLNKDGINDAYILQKGGHKIPMYGVRTYRGIEYVSARDMEQRPNNIIDYDSIEDKLNGD